MENVFYFGNRTMIIIIISLACKWEPGKTVRYHHLNDVIARSLASAGVPVSKEPQGLSRFDGKRPDGLTLIRACLSYGIWQCLTQLRIPTWKLLLARQALQPSWQHLTRWSRMLDCHHRVNSSDFGGSPTAQSTGMLFSSCVSWAGDWWRRPGMFEHLRFYSNRFPLWCNVLIRFCCMMVLLMITGQSRVLFQTNFLIFFCNFWATRGFPLIKKINNNNYRTDDTGMHQYDLIRVFKYTQQPIPIRLFLALVSQPLISLYQAGRLENAAILRNGWHTPSKTQHADH